MKLFLRSFWYLINIFFCCFNLNSLINNKFTTMIDYSYADLKVDHLSICLSISSSRLKCDEIKDSSLNEICNKLRDFYLFIENKSKFKTPNDLINQASELRISLFFKFKSNSSRIEFKEYYLNQNSLCMFYKLEFNHDLIDMNVNDPEHLVKKNAFILNLFNLYKIENKIHFHSHPLPRAIGYHETFKCKNFIKCKNVKAHSFQYKYSYLPSPYDTDCLNYSIYNFGIKSNEEINSQMACYQECLKEKFRSSYFLYSKLEKTHNYELNDDFNQLNQIDSKHVNYCKAKCKSQSCSFIYHSFYRVNYLEGGQDHSEIFIHSKFLKCIAKSRVSDFDFWVSFFGFISLTFGLNFLKFTSKIIKHLNFLINKIYDDNDDFKKLFELIEKLFLILLYFTGLILTNLHLSEYLYNNLSNLTILSLSVDPNNLTLAMCVKITNLDNLANLSFYEIETQSAKYEELSQWPIL